MNTTWKAILSLMRFDRPVGSLLLLWSTMGALWLAAKGMPSLHYLGIFILGVMITRAAGSTVNDIADRHLDPHVARTAGRPLAAGLLSLKTALIVFLILIMGAAFLLISLPPRCWVIAMIGLGLMILYPFSKRFFACPQFVLGIVWSFGILMAFSAISGELTIIAWLTFMANFTLTMAYDTQYAMADRNDDIKMGVNSSAILFGRADKLMVGLFQVLTVGLWILIAWIARLPSIFYVAIIAASFLFLYQQRLIVDRDPNACFYAFLNNQWVGFLLWLGLVFSYDILK